MRDAHEGLEFRRVHFRSMAKFVLKTLPGINRPAIASFFPTLRGESVMLDLGANVQCDAENLVDFAVMGNAFARSVLGLREPTYALLNVGSEESQGPESLQEPSAALRSTSGRAHVCTPVTNAPIVCRLLLETKTLTLNSAMLC